MKFLRGQPINQIDIADDFYEAYRLCFNTETDRIYSIPGFVNGLFACELYLKILVGAKAASLRGKKKHNLGALYNLLESDEKNRLRSVKNNGGYDFEYLIKKIGDGFVVWRYLYEDGNERFGGGDPFLYTEAFLEHYLPALKMMARARME